MSLDKGSLYLGMVTTPIVKEDRVRERERQRERGIKHNCFLSLPKKSSLESIDK